MEFARWSMVASPEEMRDWSFRGLEEMCKTIHLFGDIDAFVIPLVPSMEDYSAKKMFILIHVRVECRIQDPREREECDRATARQIVASEDFGGRIFGCTRRCFLLDVYQRLRERKKRLPQIHEGIGMCFLRHIDKFNKILKELLKVDSSELRQLMKNVELKEEWIDHYAGQSIFNFFEAWARRLPQPPYCALKI
ncbi:MAG: hypothetical protein QMD77_03145 [Patescibacteria group bacterium]|nr:hypothetical protein [Patescibacteria group bacterium]